MCLAIPGRIKKIDGRKAVVQYPKGAREALLGEENLRVGDYVMVQMGIIVKKLSSEEARFAGYRDSNAKTPVGIRK